MYLNLSTTNIIGANLEKFRPTWEKCVSSTCRARVSTVPDMHWYAVHVWTWVPEDEERRMSTLDNPKYWSYMTHLDVSRHGRVFSLEYKKLKRIVLFSYMTSASCRHRSRSADICPCPKTPVLLRSSSSRMWPSVNRDVMCRHILDYV